MSALLSLKHSNIYLFGLMVMAVGLPSSNLLMSISQVIIATNWVIEGDYGVKIKRFLANKPALIFTSIFGLHLIGLFYTSNFDYAAWDIRNKVPLLVLPFLIASSPALSSEKLAHMFRVFIAAIVVISIVCAGELTPFNNWVRELFNYPPREIIDVRSISQFISHIRFALMISLSLFWLCHQMIYAITTFRIRLVYATIVLWLTVFLFLLESVTGIIIVFLIGFASILFLVKRQNNQLIKRSALAVLILVPSLTIGYIGSMVVDFYHVNEEDVAVLPKITSSGGVYFHDLDNHQLENGNYVWRYVCHTEVVPEWEKRSMVPFVGKDKAGQFIEYTLFRYLTSRGLHKDAEGMAALSDEEIRRIENGVANVKFAEVASIESRIYGIIWQIHDYNQHGAPGGHSLSQRWEFWKTGLGILKDNPLIGVGTGDVYDKMLKQYENDDSLLASAYRKHAHNQYLSIAIGFGLIGLSFFLWGMLYPVILNWNMLDYIALVFVTIVLLSMLTEDTLETQAGVSFVAFFYSILILGRGEELKPDF